MSETSKILFTAQMCTCVCHVCLCLRLSVSSGVNCLYYLPEPIQGTALLKRLKEIDIEYPQAASNDDEYADERGDLFTNIRCYTLLAA